MFLLSKNLHLNAHKVSILNRQHKVLKSILKPFKAHFIGISAHGTGIKIRFAKQALQFPSIEEMGAVNETAVPPTRSYTLSGQLLRIILRNSHVAF